MATPLYKNPAPGITKFTVVKDNLIFLGYHYWGGGGLAMVIPKVLTLRVRGHEIYNLLSSKTYRYYILNLVKIGPLVLENMLTNGAYRTTTNGNQ